MMQGTMKLKPIGLLAQMFAQIIFQGQSYRAVAYFSEMFLNRAFGVSIHVPSSPIFHLQGTKIPLCPEFACRLLEPE